MNTLQTFTVDTETRELLHTPELEAAIPGIARTLNQVDSAYSSDSEAYVHDLASGRFERGGITGGKTQGSLIYDAHTANSTEIGIIFAPFSKVAPNSSAATLSPYLGKKGVGFKERQTALAHSWGQLFQSRIFHDALKAQGRGMPIVTYFNPMPPRMFTKSERDLIASGDFYSMGHLAVDGVEYAQDQIHGTSGTTRIDGVNFYGASLGATQAIGAHVGLSELSDEVETRTVTAQELILGVDSVAPELVSKFMFSQITGDGPEHTPFGSRFPEPLPRREQDQIGNELGMYTRDIKAMAKLTMLRGLTDRNGTTAAAIKSMVENGVDFTLATALNSSITAKTLESIDSDAQASDHFHHINIQGLKDQKLGHIINEYFAGSLAVLLAGVTARPR